MVFIRYFYCACLTRPPDFLSRFRNLAGATQRIKVHPETKSQVAPAEEAVFNRMAEQGLPKYQIDFPFFKVSEA